MSKLFIAVAVVMALVSMVQADPCLTNTVGCQSTTTVPALPAYIAGSSGYINSKLQVALSVSLGYQSVAIAFNPDLATPLTDCNHNLYTCDSFWNETTSGCTATLIGRFDAVLAIDNCFTLSSQDGNINNYKAIVRVTATQNVGTLRGRSLNRTSIISFTLTASLARTTSVTYNNLKTSNPFAVNETIILQDFTLAARSARLLLFTSVQFPYSLSVLSQNTPTATYSLTPITTPAAGANVPVVNCNNTFAAVCEQVWETTLSTSDTAACLISANINLLFNVNCRAGTNATLCATFTTGSYNYSTAVLSSNYCPNVLFTGSLTSTMLPYRTETGTVTSNGFILGERVYFQINVSSNIGAIIAATNVTSIVITKSPFTATITAGQTTGGFLLKNSADVGTATKAVFSFILSTTTVPNPTEGVEDTVSVLANLKITYLTEVNKLRTMTLAVPLGSLKQLLANDDDTVSSNILVTPPSVTATTQSTSSNALVVGVAVGAALLALVAILVLAVIVRRNKQNKETGTSPIPKEVE